MNAGLAMVVSSAALLGISLYIAVAGLETVEWESNIDFKRFIGKGTENVGKKKSKGRKKKRSG